MGMKKVDWNFAFVGRLAKAGKGGGVVKPPNIYVYISIYTYVCFFFLN